MESNEMISLTEMTREERDHILTTIKLIKQNKERVKLLEFIKPKLDEILKPIEVHDASIVVDHLYFAGPNTGLTYNKLSPSSKFFTSKTLDAEIYRRNEMMIGLMKELREYKEFDLSINQIENIVREAIDER